MADSLALGDTETRFRSIGHAGLLVVGAFAVGFLLAGVTFSTMVSIGFDPQSDIVALLVASTISQFAGFYLVVYWYFQTLGDFGELVHAHTPSLRDVGWALGGLLALIVANLLISELLVNVGLEGAQNQIIEQGRETPVLFLALIPVTVLFVAPAEELVFRGAIQGLMRGAYGVAPGVLLASAIFALAHIPALGETGNVSVTIGLIFVLGLILSTVYELSESILVCTAVHAGWNVSIFAWEYAATTGLV